jgi:hypothetical protein
MNSSNRSMHYINDAVATRKIEYIYYKIINFSSLETFIAIKTNINIMSKNLSKVV